MERDLKVAASARPKRKLHQMLISVVVLAILPSTISSNQVDCRRSCRRCQNNQGHPSVLEVYCAMCDECKLRRREKLEKLLRRPGKDDRSTPLLMMRRDRGNYIVAPAPHFPDYCEKPSLCKRIFDQFNISSELDRDATRTTTENTSTNGRRKNTKARSGRAANLIYPMPVPMQMMPQMMPPMMHPMMNPMMNHIMPPVMPPVPWMNMYHTPYPGYVTPLPHINNLHQRESKVTTTTITTTTETEPEIVDDVTTTESITTTVSSTNPFQYLYIGIPKHVNKI